MFQDDPEGVCMQHSLQTENGSKIEFIGASQETFVGKSPSPFHSNKKCFVYCGPERCDCQIANDLEPLLGGFRGGGKTLTTSQIFDRALVRERMLQYDIEESEALAHQDWVHEHLFGFVPSARSYVIGFQKLVDDAEAYFVEIIERQQADHRSKQEIF